MQDWMIAVMKKDEQTLNKIVAPEFKLDDVYHSFPPGYKKDMVGKCDDTFKS